MRGLMFGSAVLSLAIAATASADVLFNNFGAGDSYNTGSGWTISDGSPINTDWDQGDAFTVSGGNYFLDSIEAAIGLVLGQNRVFIDIYDDAGGQPGSVLESVTIEDQMGPFGSFNAPIVGNFSGSTLLMDGMTYWAIASSDSNSWLAWNQNDQGDIGPHASSPDGAPWNVGPNTRGAFRINGTLPAPGALALLGLAGLAGTRRRR